MHVLVNVGPCCPSSWQSSVGFAPAKAWPNSLSPVTFVGSCLMTLGFLIKWCCFSEPHKKLVQYSVRSGFLIKTHGDTKEFEQIMKTAEDGFDHFAATAGPLTPAQSAFLFFVTPKKKHKFANDVQTSKLTHSASDCFDAFQQGSVKDKRHGTRFGLDRERIWTSWQNQTQGQGQHWII